jgi:hypothetical protein
LSDTDVKGKSFCDMCREKANILTSSQSDWKGNISS